MAAAYFYLPFPTAFTSNGLPAPGARVFFYLTGTLTPADSFTTVDMATPHANPVVANGAGHLPSIYLNSAVTYRVIIKDRTGNTLEDIDPYIPGTAAGAELLAPYSTSAASSATAAAVAATNANSAKLAAETALAANQAIVSLAKGDKGDPGTGGGLGLNLANYLDPARIPFVTDDLPAFEAALAALPSTGGQLNIPAGRYYLSNTLNIHKRMRLIGEGTDWVADGSTVIRFGKNCNGIVINNGNTHGDGLGTQGIASGTTIEGISLWGGNVNVNASGGVTSYSAGDSTTGHGVRIRTTGVKLKDVCTAFFGNDGFNIVATAGAGGFFEGNANNFQVSMCQSIYNSGYGFFAQGSDANAGTIADCSAISCAGAGFVDFSFLGNLYSGCHVRDCGGNNPVIAGGVVGVAEYLGNRYHAAANQLVAASTTVPGTNPAVWIQNNGLIGGRSWVSGQTWLIAGAYISDPANANSKTTFLGCYAEDGMAAQQHGPTLVIGGFVGGGGTIEGVDGSQVYASRQGVASKAFEALNKSTGQSTGIGHLVGLNDTVTFFYHANGTATPTKKLKIDESPGLDGYALTVHGAFCFGMQTDGLYLPNGNSIKFNGDAVLKQRQAAVADAAAETATAAVASAAAPTKAEFDALVGVVNALRADSASMRTALNTLLARLRPATGHGLIA